MTMMRLLRELDLSCRSSVQFHQDISRLSAELITTEILELYSEYGRRQHSILQLPVPPPLLHPCRSRVPLRKAEGQALSHTGGEDTTKCLLIPRSHGRPNRIVCIIIIISLLLPSSRTRWGVLSSTSPIVLDVRSRLRRACITGTTCSSRGTKSIRIPCVGHSQSPSPIQCQKQQDICLAALYVSTKMHDTLKKPKELLAVSYGIRHPELAARSKHPAGEVDLDTMDPQVSYLSIIIFIIRTAMAAVYIYAPSCKGDRHAHTYILTVMVTNR